jgi:MFS family permease
MAGAANQRRSRKHPFEKSYGVNLTVAILALVPFIILTTAYELYEKQIGAEISIPKNALSIISALSTAAYAFGALLGGDVIQRFAQRELFFLCESMFIVGCTLAASGFGMVQFGGGMVLLAFSTGLLLVIALPPVIRRFPAEKMPITAGVVNLGFFGATTLGPIVGGVIAFAHAWRWLYAGFGALGLGVLTISFFALPRQDPMDSEARFDFPAVVLAFFASVLPFLAAGELTGHTFRSYWFTAPLAVGMACFVAMLLSEYHQKNPLSPVKPMWHTIPLFGTLAAMFGGGVFVTLLMLAERYEMAVLHKTALSTGLLFWPQVLGAILTAGLLMILVRTRYLAILVLGGMLMLIGAGVLLLYEVPGQSRPISLAGAGLLGLGPGPRFLLVCGSPDSHCPRRW